MLWQVVSRPHSSRTRTTIGAKTGTEKARAADLLKRDFHTSAPNRAWVTDFT